MNDRPVIIGMIHSDVGFLSVYDVEGSDGTGVADIIVQGDVSSVTSGPGHWTSIGMVM